MVPGPLVRWCQGPWSGGAGAPGQVVPGPLVKWCWAPWSGGDVCVLPCQVSRCGMIYMEPHMLGWEPLMKSWLNTLPKTFTSEHKELITDLYQRFLPCCLDFVKKAGFKVVLVTKFIACCIFIYTCTHTHTHTCTTRNFHLQVMLT